MFRALVFILLISFSQISFSVEEAEQIIVEDLGEEEIAQDEETDDNFNHNKAYAKIQILNKITAKIKYLDIKIGSEAVFDSLKIKALSCWKSSPYDLSENKILLEILEKKIESKQYSKIFEGWMFSSSPAISTIEHPIYDVIAVDCH